MTRHHLTAWALTGLFLMTTSVQAQVAVGDPWVRATVPQQKATGMFAQITAAQGGKLVAASSPVASVVEIHEMAMDNNVMRMPPSRVSTCPPARRWSSSPVVIT